MTDTAYLLGSREWFELAKKRLNESEDLKAASADWEGTMRCLIYVEDELAVKDYATPDGAKAMVGMLGMLSKEERLEYKGTGLEKLLNKAGYNLEDDPADVNMDEIIENIKGLTLEDFKGATIYASFEPHRGVLREMDPISPEKYKDAPFALAGSYESWKELCSGRQSPIQLIMSGKMKLTGDMQFIMKRMAAVNALMAVYKSIPLK
jgi:putative sterol carrier protein